MAQFHFFPRLYLRMIRNALPAYDLMQDEVARATAGQLVRQALDLGSGTGETARRVLELHEDARVVCIDCSARVLRVARQALPKERASFYRQDLDDPFPAQRFDLVTSALAIHHLDKHGKQGLFDRIARALSVRGLFVMADVVVPEDPADAVTPLDRRHDRPSRLDDQLAWMREAGLAPRLCWSSRDLAVVAARRARGGVAMGEAVSGSNR